MDTKKKVKVVLRPLEKLETTVVACRDTGCG